MYKPIAISYQEYINDNKDRQIKSFLTEENKNKLPLCKPLMKLLINESIMYYPMQYHDAGLIASCINRYTRGFIIKGGFTRELCRAFSKIIINKDSKLNGKTYYFNDLDIHLTSCYELDINELIKNEQRTYYILNMFMNILGYVGCKIKNINYKDLRLKTKVIGYKNITLYDLQVVVGSKKSKFQILDTSKEYIHYIEPDSAMIFTQIVFHNNSRFSDFVCNQICLSQNNHDNYVDYNLPVLGIKEQCYDYMQKYSNLQKKKVFNLLKLHEVTIPDIIINKILSYLNFNTRRPQYQDHRMGCFYLDKDSMSRCKNISYMSIDDVFNQLAKDTTYFIGDCKEIGCIPKDEETVNIIKYTSLLLEYKWDYMWISEMTDYNSLLYRIKKIEDRGIKVINCCESNNPNCLWHIKNHKFINFENLY
jgi:hypothetical protein